MKLTVLGSNSNGNGYLLQSDNGQSLLIECGIHIKKIKQALQFNLQNLSAIVTHSHGDHAKHIRSVMEAGINVYSGEETLKACGVADHHRANVLQAGKQNVIQGFKIKAFAVNHDVPCLGFIIYHEEMGLCVFLTDTYYCEYVFPKANQYIVECNHDQDIMYNNGTKQFLRDRIMLSHMNMDTCRDLLMTNDLTSVNNIVLIHLSDRNSDARMFKKEIAQSTGKTVHIAEPGMIIENFNKTPF